MEGMSSRMNGILERVLSQEIARQEVWSKEDVERFGEHMNRDALIAELRKFMQDNGIKFNQEWYIRTEI